MNVTQIKVRVAIHIRNSFNFDLVNVVFALREQNLA